MNMDDDQNWLDALAGRGITPSATTREAHALRSALLAQASIRGADRAPDNVISIRNSAREDALIERAVRDGLIDTPRAATSRRWTWQLPVAASVLLVFAAGIYVRLLPTSTPVVRGSEDGIVRLQTRNASALKQTILNELRAAGVSVTGYEALGVHGIDADLPVPLSPEVKRVLAAHDIPEPRDGVLRIEIRSTE